MPKTSPTDQLKALRDDIRDVKHDTVRASLHMSVIESKLKVVSTDLIDQNKEIKSTRALFHDLNKRFDSIDEKLFLWKSQLFDKIDNFLERINSQDKEIGALSNRTSNHSDRIERLEIKSFGSAQA